MRAAALVLPLAAVLLTGCSGSPEAPAEAPDRTDLVRAALASTREAGTARVALTSESTVGGRPFEVTGEGVVDLSGEESQLTLTLPIGEVQQRTVDGTAYISAPQEPGVFYSVDAEQLRGSALGGSSDPTSPLSALEGVRDVEEVGPEQVRGADATRYDGTVDVQQALERAQGPQRAQLESTLGRAGLDELPFSVWLDEEGRLVRFRQELSLPASEATGGQPLETTTTVELFDHGVEVDVQAPPADQVRDGSRLLGRLPGA